MKREASKHRLLTPDQALRKVLAYLKLLPPCRLNVREACGFVLAEHVRAADDLPRFDNSAVDGFAVRAADLRGASQKHPVALRLIGEARAGRSFRGRLRAKCAIRISTGAPIPAGADAVVMQEDCQVRGSTVSVRSTGGNIRFKGEEIRKGRTALRRGALLAPGSVAWLATMGIKRVSVVRRPRVGLLRSGSEVVEPGRRPRPDQVRDAHGLSLSLALGEMGIGLETAAIARDDPASIRRAFKKLLGTCDVLLTTGGVSVGRHDWFREVAADAGVREIFHKIAQKPGKPMVFGVKSGRLWFGLPGNPVSALFCFYYYVRPVLWKLAGRKDFMPRWFEAASLAPVRRHPVRTEFLRGCMQQGRVRFAVKQGSHCLGSFAESDVLVKITPGGGSRRNVLCMRV